MPANKKQIVKKSSKKRPPNNPTDPNLLARSVIESFIGEPLTPSKRNPQKPKITRKPAKKK
jgi:hypothetical protein